jgi:hypothetical protein
VQYGSFEDVINDPDVPVLVDFHAGALGIGCYCVQGNAMSDLLSDNYVHAPCPTNPLCCLHIVRG